MRTIRTAGAVFAATMIANGLAYAAPLVGARTLPPEAVGELAVALAISSCAALVGLGLQTAVAVRQARMQPEGIPQTTLVAALATGAAIGAVTLVAAATLHLSGWLAPALALMSAAVVLGSRYLGDLQGKQQFALLAVGLILQGVSRYAGVIAGVALAAPASVAMGLGAALCWLTLPVIARLAKLSGRVAAAVEMPADDARLPSLPAHIWAAISANIAMFAVSYADLILARRLLPVAESGAYAVGGVLTKGAIWAPAVITMIALPRIARHGGSALRGAALAVAGCGLALVLLAAGAGRLAFWLAGGDAYVYLAPYAPLFAAVGALYAMAFLLVNARIARGVRFASLPLWAAIPALAIVVAVWSAQTVGQIAVGSVAAAGACTLLLLVMAARQ